MYTIKKPGLPALVISLIMVSHLLGVTKVTGKLLIPIADGSEPYKCVIVITQSAIVLECDKKIFQPLNQFDSPKEAKLKLNMVEIEKVEIQRPVNSLYIITRDSFSMRYRNYFHQAYMTPHLLSSEYEQYWVLACTIDSPADTVVIGNELSKILGERFRIVTIN